ncbi:AAA family ATPase [Rhodococcus sp. NPDC057014]|uniref:AAA family ATPase n=1 Tax=Rhodococcus sp. NPDC057014 TaxID=3346000 RepID=UPI00362C1F23
MMADNDLPPSYAEAIKNLPSKREIEDASSPVLPENWSRTQTEAEVYLPGADLARVTDLAIALGRPLLLQGEPGCGKTRLAHSVAYALGMPLEIAYVKSTSRAQDLLYTYDAVRRLYDSQLGAEGPKDDKKQPLVRFAGNYITLGPLGRAIARAEYGRQSVVLIDEIDKADLDFPNDLLWELDRMEFDIPEAPGMGHRAGRLRPFVVVTHNEEKPMPPAFLRRCVYYYVEFPQTHRELERILQKHGVGSALTKKSAELITELRQKDLSKKPGLAELIDWVRYEDARGITPDRLAELPDAEALLKDRADLERVRKDLAQT